MPIRIGINGFGRMGRLAFRAGWGQPDLEFVHINEIAGGAATYRLVTAASCTTNCLAPVVKVVHQTVGIRHGVIGYVHRMIELAQKIGASL